MAFGLLAPGIELDEVVGHFLDPLFGFGFEGLPVAGSQFVQGRCGAVFGVELGNFVQAVDADVQHVVVPINQLDGFLNRAADVDFLQAAEFPDPVVQVGHKVAHL